MGGYLEWFFRSKGAWRTAPDWLLLPLDRIYQQLLRTKDQEKRLRIYEEANEYIADQALWVFTVAPLSLYGVNKEVEFISQPSQCLFLDYSSVTENHWSLRGKNN
jgi:ABC-type transport system substrate-binding protein